MFKNLRERRARGDILDFPDWAYLAYLASATIISIFIAICAIDLLPLTVAPINLMTSLLFGFMGIGIFLHEWGTRSPLKPIIPMLLFVATLSLGLLFAPLFLFGPIDRVPPSGVRAEAT